MTYLLAGLCVLLPLCWLSGFAVGRSDKRAMQTKQEWRQWAEQYAKQFEPGRHLPPGSTQPLQSASGSGSLATAAPRPTFTEFKVQTAGTAGLPTFPARVRISSPTDSGSVTEFPLGGRMTAADGAA